MTDFSLSWNTFDLVCSLAASLRGEASVSYCLARPKGQKQYQVMVAIGGQTVDLQKLLSQSPQTDEFLKNHGFSLSSEDLTAFVLQEMQQDRWNARYAKKEQWTQSPWRKLPAKFFATTPLLHQWYWNEAIEHNAPVCPQDKWAVDLHQALQCPSTKENMQKASLMMNSFSLKRQSWESQSGQSLRFWAQGDAKWQRFLDKWDVSYRHSHNNTALILWALSNNWGCVVKGWQRETKLGMEFMPPFEEIPSKWQNDNGQNGSLWHWACAVSPVPLLKTLVSENDFNINALSSYGQTALHWACAMGNDDTVRFLMSLPNIQLDAEDPEHKIPSELLPERCNDLFDELEALRLQKSQRCLEKQK